MAEANAPSEELTVDLLVVGSGAGGMTTALSGAAAGLDVLLVEKADSFGGSTSLSGGGIWIPNSPTLHAAGIVDEREDVLTYLRTITEGTVDEARLAAFVDNGPATMQLLERSPHLSFHWVKGYADYHPEAPGGRPMGRTVEPNAIDTQTLGELERDQQEDTMKGPLGLWVSAADYRKLTMVRRTWAGRWAALVAAWRVVSNVFRRRHMSAGGRALCARLRLALRDAGVPLWLGSPLTELVTEDRRVVGAVVERDGVPVRIHARHGVVLATGGFEHNEEMRDDHLPDGGRRNFSAGADSNTGDGIRIGQDLGAAVSLMDDAWWMPSVVTPSGRVLVLVSERSIPNSIIVGTDGRRFTNESSPYVNFVHDQLASGNHEAWFIMDATARKRYPFAQVLPGNDFRGSWFKAGLVHKADSIEALAASTGLPADELRATVDRFNGFVRAGRDEEFGRGDSAYDRYYGDPTLDNPAMGPIDRGPFYAVRIEVGDLGTKGGLVTDEHARVLTSTGDVIDGLYATGNTSASVMGNDYAGAGATIGPAMVFGHIAAQHAATARTSDQPTAHLDAS